MIDLPHHQIAGPPGAPVVILGPSLGTALRLWDPQARVLARRWRVVAFDLPGHGGSPSPPAGVTIGSMADAVCALADRIGAPTFGYCGISLGGAIGQHLAATRPDRVDALVLCCTSARFSDNAPAWRERARQVRASGTAWLEAPSRQRWFTAAFTERSAPVVEEILTGLRDVSPDGYAACCDALAQFDGRPLLPRITAPTLVLAGAADPATPVPLAEELVAATGADLIVLTDSAHLATVEQPDLATRHIAEHLERHLR